MPIEVARDRFGRPLVIPPDGGKPVAYRRCTTFIGALSDTYNLQKWGQRMVASGLAQRPDILLSVCMALDDDAKLDKICEQAKEAAGASVAATIGTELHRLIERFDRGETFIVPPRWMPDLAAYKAATNHMKVLDAELFVVNDDLKVAGTLDQLVDDGIGVFIADLKTGKIDFDPNKIAMQLAVYASGSRYNAETGERTPLNADKDRGYVFHLPAGKGTCTVLWADLKQGWEGVQLALDVWDWRKRKGMLTPVSA